MNFYDVLAAEKWGGGIPTTNFFDLLFAQFISGKKWEIYEGTLPATFNANGDDMRQYRVWGNTGGVGDRTINLFDLSTTVFGKYIDSNGNEQTSAANPSWGTRLHHSDYFPVEVEQEYVFFSTCGARLYSVTVAFCWYDADKNFLSRTTTTLPVDASATEYSFNGVAPQNAKFAIVNFVTNRYANVMITPGTTPPETYVPFGYEVDMSTSDGTNATTTPIYIGSDPLGKDEYVDYQAGKIYRMIDGTLTPTDPPVPLPALPTCEGMTIMDYVGGGTAPEKVYFEYQGGEQP